MRIRLYKEVKILQWLMSGKETAYQDKYATEGFFWLNKSDQSATSNAWGLSLRNRGIQTDLTKAMSKPKQARGDTPWVSLSMNLGGLSSRPLEKTCFGLLRGVLETRLCESGVVRALPERQMTNRERRSTWINTTHSMISRVLLNTVARKGSITATLHESIVSTTWIVHNSILQSLSLEQTTFCLLIKTGRPAKCLNIT